jgi:hypothetical protein
MFFAHNFYFYGSCKLGVKKIVEKYSFGRCKIQRKKPRLFTRSGRAQKRLVRYAIENLLWIVICENPPVLF